MSSPILTKAIQTARLVIDQNPLFLDTETTGLDPTAEIVDIAIVNDRGEPLFQSLVRPRFPIPSEVTAIHGITNEDVQNEKSFPLIWPEIKEILENRLVVIYNAQFDLRMIYQSLKAYYLVQETKIQSFDMIKLYAEFYGMWDEKYKAYKFQSLKAAGMQAGIDLQNTHRALDDCLLTRALLHHVADFTP